MSRVMIKPTFCICKNKGTDQFRSHCEADQRIYFSLHTIARAFYLHIDSVLMY